MRTCLHKRDYIKAKKKLPKYVQDICNEFESICISVGSWKEFELVCKERFGDKFAHTWVDYLILMEFAVKIKGKNQYRIEGVLSVINNTIYIYVVGHRKNSYKSSWDNYRMGAFECYD